MRMQKLELPEDSMLCSGHAACPGCVDALSVRHVLAALGPKTMAIIPPSCMAIIAGPQPYSSLRIPVYQPSLESSAAAASGLRRALDARGEHDTQVIVLAGDGGTYDIGFQCLSSAAERNENFIYFCLDNEGYMNTGAQKSGATRFGADRSTSPIGSRYAGKTTLHRRIVAQAMSISHVYAAKLSIDNPQYAIKILKEAIAYNGPSVVEFFSGCPQGQQAPDWAAPLISRMMVEARKWQIAVRRPFQRLDISANPEPEKIYPAEGKSFKKGLKRDPATFYDVVSMLGQYNQHIKTRNGDFSPEIIQVNEMVSLFRWLRSQYLAGYRDTMPTEEEVEQIVAERYRV